MKFLESIGLLRKPAVELDEEQFEIVRENAEIFLRAGELRTEDWAEMSADERRAFAEAGDRVWARRMVAFAEATGQDAETIARIRAVFDGGLSLAKILLERKVDEIQNRMAS